MGERPIWREGDGSVAVIDQTRLPHDYVVVHWRSLADAAHGIRSMQVRGAPLIGAAAAYGLALAMDDDPSDPHAVATILAATRPTAVNLRWALDRLTAALLDVPLGQRAERAMALADELTDTEAEACRAIGEAGVGLIESAAAAHPERRVNVMTHCNAGWLACTEWGTATAPIYSAVERGIDVHVWVSETRPRNQGASLTAWELGRAGVPHSLIVDNAAGHLLQHGLVDLVIVGADRIAANGDTANKIGTYLKAVAAADCTVPFHVAAPLSTFDMNCATGAGIPIEERSDDEVLMVHGSSIAPEATVARNWGFDVTPARLITGFITECGLAEPGAIGGLFDADR